jgi:hypothetical protein
MSRKEKREVIINIGGEGGAITLHGIRRWCFQIEVNDSTPGLISEPSIHNTSGIVDSWDAALVLLDKYPWTELAPLAVHPDFRRDVWKAVQIRAKTDEARKRWQKRCNPARPISTITEVERLVWPELIYRLVEHYKWEPQWLYKGEPAEKFYQGIRQQEVPLNFLFHLLLRLSQPETIGRILAEFVPENDSTGFEDAQLKFPPMLDYVQPDIWMETPAKRIFIEVKVGAKIELEQVQRYLLLHAEMNIQRPKDSYLFFLTGDEFGKCWSPRESVGEDVPTFLRQKILAGTIPAKLGKKIKSGRILDEEYNAVKDRVQYGAASWNSVANCLSSIMSECRSGNHETDIRIYDDFLSDLKRRKLWKDS